MAIRQSERRGKPRAAGCCFVRLRWKVSAEQIDQVNGSGKMAFPNQSRSAFPESGNPIVRENHQFN